MKVEVYFAGLICLEGLEKEKDKNRIAKVRATLIDDDDHMGYICLNGQETQLDARTKVKFKGVGSGLPASARGFVQRALPHLADLTKDGIELNRAAPGIHVVLPNAPIVVAAVYEENGAKYTLNRPPCEITEIPCVARLTLMTLESKQNEKVVVSYNDTSYTFEAEGWLMIENAAIETPESMAMPMPKTHFTKHHNVTTGGEDDIADYEEIQKGDCGTIEPGAFTNAALDHLHVRHPRTATQPECSNSLWP